MFRKRTGFAEDDPDRGIVFRDHRTACLLETDIPTRWPDNGMPIAWTMQELARPGWTCEIMNLAADIVADS